MPLAKTKRPAKTTPKVRHDFFVYPRGKLTNENVFALFESFGSMIADRDQVPLPVEGKGKVPTFSITREEVFQLYRTKDLVFGEDYRLFRKNPKTGSVTTVPENDLRRVRNDPVVRSARQALTALVNAQLEKSRVASKA